MTATFQRTRSHRKFQCVILSAAALLASAQFAVADNFLWTGTTSSLWNQVDANWDNTTLPATGVPWTNNANRATPNGATFSLAVPPASITVNDNMDVASLNFTTANWNIAAGTGVLSSGATGTITVTATNTATIGAVIADGSTYGVGGGATSLLLNGFTLVLANTNTYTGTTTVTGGATLSTSADANLGNGSGAGNIVLNGGSLQATANYTLNSARGISVGPASAVAGTGTIDVTGTNVLTYNGAIANNGTAADNFTKTGTGTLLLGGANTYTGTTTINGGLLQLSGTLAGNPVTINGGGTLKLSGSTLLATTTLTVNSGAASGGTFDLNGQNQTVATLTGSANTVSGIITNTAAGTSTLSVNQATGTTYNGQLNDGGAGAILAVTKSGAGTLTLTGSSNFSGLLTVNGGAVAVTSAAALGAGNMQIGNSATMFVNGTFSLPASKGIILGLGINDSGTLDNRVNGGIVTINGTLSDNSGGAGALIRGSNSAAQANGAIVLAGSSNYSGNTTINGNALIGGDANYAIRGGLIAATNNAFGNATGGTFINASGLLGFQGGVQYTTAEPVTFSSTTQLSSGSIRSISGDNLFAGSIALSTGANIFGTDPESSLTLTGTLTGSGSVTKVGAGTLIFATTQNYAGNTDIKETGNGLGQQWAPGTVKLVGTVGLTGSSVRLGASGVLLVDSSANSAASVTRTASLRMAQAATLIVNGNNANNTLDSFGDLFLGPTNGAGEVFVVINPGANQTSTVAFNNLNRDSNANSSGNGVVVNFRGPHFGAQSGTGTVAQATVTTFVSPAGLVGAAAGITGHLPYATITDTATGQTSIATVGSYGLRPLSTSVADDYNTGTSQAGVLTSGNVLLTGTATITGTTGAVTSLSMQGNAIDLTGGGGTALRVGTRAGTNILLSTGTGNTITVPTLTFGGTGAGTSDEINFYVEGDLTVNSNITNAGSATNLGIIKSGPGDLTLGGTNTFASTVVAGTIRIYNGSLSFSSPANLGGNANEVNLFTGGKLRLLGGLGTVVVPQIISLSRTNFGVQDPEHTFITVEGGSTLSITKLFSQSNTAAGFTKTGAGTFEITVGDNASNLAGNSFLNEGGITLKGTGAVGAALQIAGGLIMSPGTSLNIDSSGVTVSTTDPRIGFLTFNASSVNVTGSTTNATVDTSGGLTTLNSGGSSVAIIPNASHTAAFQVSTLTRRAGATLVLTGSNVGNTTVAGDAANVSQFRISNGSPITISGLTTTAATIIPYMLVTDTAAGTTLFGTYDASATVILPNASTGSFRALKSTEMTANVLTATTNVLLTSSNATGTLSIKSLTLQNTGTTTDLVNSGILTNTSGGILSTGTAANAITGGTMAFGATEGMFHVYADLAVSSNITGSAGLTKAGTGKLTLSGTNTYTGPRTWINGGTLSVTSSDNLGGSAVGVTLNMGATLEVTGAGLVPTGTRALTVNAGGGTNINVTDATSVFAFGGGLAGSGNLTKGGAGALTLGGPSTYTGNINLNAGTLGGTVGTTGSIVPGASAHAIAPSAGLAAGSTTTLTAGAVATNANTTLAFHLVSPGASSVNDKIVATAANGLTINGGTLAITATTTGIPSLGYYKAIQYSGTIGGAGIGSITMPAPSNNVVYVLETTHDAGFVDIHRGYLGDANDNGTVEFNDFLLLSQNFGQAGGWDKGNFLGSPTIDFNNFLVLSQHFGETIGSGSLVATPDDIAAFHAAADAFFAGAGVPEPASLALLGLGAVTLFARRRRS